MSQRQANPADSTNIPSITERTRIPFSVPVSKLSVPEIPGFHLHWFNGTPQRIERALSGGYEFVDRSEVVLNDRTLGSTIEDGNTDMGTRVSQVAGGDVDHSGQAIRLYLMKIKQEWWEKDQRDLTAEGSRLDGVRRGLLGGTIGAEKQNAEDRAQTYLDTKRTKMPDFLTRKN